MSYEAPWRNRNHQLYEQYCYEDELPEKLRRIFSKEGSCFDDQWQYFRAHHRKPQRQVIVRRPLWMNVSTTERFADGKGRTKQPNFQTHIDQCVECNHPLNEHHPFIGTCAICNEERNAMK